jgi:hypothetical protein
VSQPQIGFDLRKIRVPLDRILPVRAVKDPQTRIERFKAILSSIKEMGLIEPLMIYPKEDQPGTYLLMDGGLRFIALKELGEIEADCVVAHDNESFTYNARISRLSPIQEHRMIKRAILNGVKPERIAAVLSKSFKAVQSCYKLLDGINEAASDLLKDKAMSYKVLCLLKKVSGVRQIEIAEFLVSSNNFTVGYVEAMVMGTPKDQWAKAEQPVKKKGLSVEEIARLEREMETVGRDFKAVEKLYGENNLSLTVIRSYAKKLLDNGKVVKFLKNNHSDIFNEFERIVAIETL